MVSVVVDQDMDQVVECGQDMGQVVECVGGAWWWCVVVFVDF